jgi:hypothetical protein
MIKKTGMDLLGEGGGSAGAPLARRGVGGGGLFFMIKQKIIRDKIRYFE